MVSSTLLSAIGITVWTAVLVTALFFGTDGIKVMPVVIVAVVVSFVLTKWLAGPPAAPQVPEPTEAAVPPQVR